MKIEKIYPKLNKIENEIQTLKNLVFQTYQIPKRLVSLRGMGKLLVSKEELDKAIIRAKKSLCKRAK